uniref:Ig-like domain-containing protein n=1 Tax=Takifugu rubripes TaxID=31033 RepID=A0A674N543_TAKRU
MLHPGLLEKSARSFSPEAAPKMPALESSPAAQSDTSAAFISLKRTSLLFTQPKTWSKMTSAKLIFWLICLEKFATMEFSPSLNWKTNYILVKPGQNLTLPCLHRDDFSTRISWFKETLGEQPILICMYWISTKYCSCANDFKNNPRFQLHPGNNGTNLTITDLKLSDSATYYCVNQYLNVFDFTEGYNVIVEGSGLTIDQSASQSIQAEGSVTLNCTVHTGWTCDGDHTVYWFRNSGPSQLGLMYSHTGSNKQCERKTNTCFYSFSMKNLNTSQIGTYYCMWTHSVWKWNQAGVWG